ncbi:hypothetical protein KA013_02420 [Patescibacteria group bacterium]|nr:hypothetical protein [Patescibacteria group bacterium]
MPTPTISYENPRPIDTRDDDEYSDDSEKEEPRLDARKSSDTIFGLFTRGIYKLHAGGGYRHTTFTVEMGRNDQADRITDKHIVTTTREGEDLHIYLL